MYNKEEILRQAENHNSFYLYDRSIILRNIQNLKNNFNGVKFLYSVKSNSNADVVDYVISNGLGIDAASGNEALIGKIHNIDICDIQYSAPAKTREEIEMSIDCATITADSLNEIFLINTISKERNIITKIGVRINPDFSFFSDEGIASKFGIDESIFFENLASLLELTNVVISGLHIHLRCQILEKEIIASYYEKILSLAKRIQAATHKKLEFINMGSGIGIDYESTDVPVDIVGLGKLTSQIVKEFTKENPKVQIYIEVGRYIVGKSGIYATKVLDKKISHGKTYVMLHNTLNACIRPCIANLIYKYNPMPDDIGGTEPLYTTKNPSQFSVIQRGKEITENEVVTLVGNLCTSADVVANDITLPKLEIGDIVIFTNVGSYSAVLSPMQFASLGKLVEVLI